MATTSTTTTATMLAAVMLLAALCGQQVSGAALDVPEMHEQMEACMAETGTTMDEVFSWADGGDASQNLKCHMKCVLLKANIMSNTGHFMLENLLPTLPADQHAVTKECAEIDQGGELCDLAYRNQLCMRDRSPDFYSDRIKLMATAAPMKA